MKDCLGINIEQKEINRILKKYKHLFEALENYDKTGKLVVKRKTKVKQ